MVVETRGRTEDGNGDGTEKSSGDGNGDEDRIREGGRESKKRKKPHKSCGRHVGNGGDLSEKRQKRRQKMIDSVAANRDNLENSKEAGGGSTRYPGLK